MRIAFYLDVVNPSIDYSDPASSNPGIGGTQFLIWSLSYHLSKEGSHEIVLFVNSDSNFPKELNIHVADSPISCIEQCPKFSIDYLVLRGPFIKETAIESAQKNNVKIISWSHNFEVYQFLESLSNKIVVKNVCVGNEQLDLLADTCIRKKSTFIYNGINFRDYDEISVGKEKNRVCYIGNLYPESGYEYILDAWPKVIEAIPDAELYIIGGNKLYHNNLKGAYSEKSLQTLKNKEKHILNLSEKINKSIHYLGVMGGKEKLAVMSSASVGVANITNAGETFGLGLVEFQALATPVVSIMRRGARETVISNVTGLLVKKPSCISDAIIYLLKNEEKAEKMGQAGAKFVRQTFNIERIVKDWVKFLDTIEEPYTSFSLPRNRFSYDNKKFVYWNYNMKKCRLLSWLPPIAFYKYLKYGVKRVFQKLNII